MSEQLCRLSLKHLEGSFSSRHGGRRRSDALPDPIPALQRIRILSRRSGHGAADQVKHAH
jgi:hypothetical protein